MPGQSSNKMCYKMDAGSELNKFPHPTAKMYTRCKYTSQLNRYNVACTRLNDFMQPTTELYTTYLNKGYNKRKVDRYFEKFIRRQMPTASPLAVTRAYAKTLLVAHLPE